LIMAGGYGSLKFMAYNQKSHCLLFLLCHYIEVDGILYGLAFMKGEEVPWLLNAGAGYVWLG